MWLSHRFAMVKAMSYVTLEAAISHGRIVVNEPEKLPDSAGALLTILPSDPPQDAASTPLEALEALQRHLRLDAPRAAEWMSAVSDARR